jgi:hypothetical protein
LRKAGNDQVPEPEEMLHMTSSSLGISGIPNKQGQTTAASDFELITWLVIRSGRTDG